jgi:hypothetical protein
MDYILTGFRVRMACVTRYHHSARFINTSNVVDFVRSYSCLLLQYSFPRSYFFWHLPSAPFVLFVFPDIAIICYLYYFRCMLSVLFPFAFAYIMVEYCYMIQGIPWSLIGLLKTFCYGIRRDVAVVTESSRYGPNGSESNRFEISRPT